MRLHQGSIFVVGLGYEPSASGPSWPVSVRSAHGRRPRSAGTSAPRRRRWPVLARESASATSGTRARDRSLRASGPLCVSDLRTVNPLSEAFVAAGEEAGFQRNPDFNGAQQDGVGFYQVTQSKGQRHSCAAAFLHPVASRKNLTVKTETHVFGIYFEGKRAAIVSFQQGNNSVQERAEREIILCAGAIGSPQLLMLSGVGPAEHLSHFNVPIACDLPGVGKNLQDHPACATVKVGCLAFRPPQPLAMAFSSTGSYKHRWRLS